MITESITLPVKKSHEKNFEADFEKAQKHIKKAKGFVDIKLQKCVDPDQENFYLLTINWETLEDHTIGFRGSDHYKEWKKLLHHYYEYVPEVLHFGADIA